MFAVIKTGGKQYKVSRNDVITIERLAAEPGDTVAFEHVLALGGETAVIGTPTVQGATVAGAVVEQARGPKTISFKKRRRQNSKRKKGHRQDLTVVRITDIFTNGEKVDVTARASVAAAPVAAMAVAAAALAPAMNRTSRSSPASVPRSRRSCVPQASRHGRRSRRGAKPTSRSGMTNWRFAAAPRARNGSSRQRNSLPASRPAPRPTRPSSSPARTTERASGKRNCDSALRHRRFSGIRQRIRA
jgi:ribosomal protein L21